MRFPHHSRVPMRDWRWEHFMPAELACRHCGEVLIHEDSLDTLQDLRYALDRPMHLSSAYRCPIHNAMVGGAPLSMHKFGRAFDVQLRGLDKQRLIDLADSVGFDGIGVNYRTFVHVDTGRRRRW